MVMCSSRTNVLPWLCVVELCVVELCVVELCVVELCVGTALHITQEMGKSLCVVKKA